MSYIGNTAQNQSFAPQVDFFSGNGVTTAFALSRTPQSVYAITVVIANVPQNPTDAFTLSGNTITFTSAPPSGTNNIYVSYNSPNTQVVQPGQGTVGTNQLATDLTLTNPTYTGTLTGGTGVVNIGSGQVYKDASGNVGIGTSSPACKFETYDVGVTGAFNPATPSTWRVAQVRNNQTVTSGSAAGIAFVGRNDTSPAGIAAVHSNTTGGMVGLSFMTVDSNATLERMRIDSSGNLLVGTTTATGKVTIGSFNSWTTGATFAGASGNSAWTTGFTSQAVSAALQTPYVMAAGGVYSVSDVRVKENFKLIESGLAFINAIEPVQFDWKADQTVDTGYKAQELLAKGYGHLVAAVPDNSMEEVIHEDGNVSPAGIRFIAKYDSVVPILHKAIQELKAELDELKAKVGE